MKTFTRMIRRYVLATAAVVLLVVGLLLGLTVYLGLHYGETSENIKNNICRHALLLCVSVRKGTTKRKDYNDRNRLCVTSWRRYQ